MILNSVRRSTLDGHIRALLAKATSARRSLQIFIPSATACVVALKAYTPPASQAALASGSFVAQVLLLILVALAGIVVLLTDTSATFVIHDAQTALEEKEGALNDLAEAEVVIEELRDQLARAARVEDIVEALRAVGHSDLVPELREFASLMARDVASGEYDHIPEPTFPDEP